MGLNRELIGKSYAAPEVHEVSAALIASYRSATNADDIAAYGGEAMIAPPLLASALTTGALTAPLLDGDLGLDLLRLSHLEHDVRVRAQVRAGTRLRARSRIVDVEDARTGEVLAIAVDVVDEDGAAVVEVMARFLVKAPRHKPALASGPPLSGEDARVDVAFVAEERVEADQSRRYAEATGDPNPIHTDSDIAQMAGFPDVILQNLCTMAFVENALVRHLDGEVSRLSRLAVRFERPVLMGDTLSIVARSGERGLSFAAQNQEGIPVIVDGRAELG